MLPLAMEDVKSTDSPEHNAVDPDEVMIGVTGVVTVTVIGVLVAEQPFPLV